MPIPGIVASQITGHLSTNSYESIATYTVGSGGSASISFTSIPSTYKHLQIRMIGKSTSSGNNCYLTINSDSGNNYSQHQIYGDGSSVSATGGGFGPVGNATNFNITNSGTPNIFGVGVMDILDYTNTNKLKTLRTLTGNDINGAGGYVIFRSTLWNSTNAITSLTFTVESGGGNLAQYTSFALYGIKGA